MSSDDLRAAMLAFLRARLDEREAAALDPIGVNQHARWLNGETPIRWSYADGKVYDAEGRPAYSPPIVRVGKTWGAEGKHIALNDPARVLAEVAAGRRIIEDYEEAHRCYREHPTEFGEGRRFAALMAVAQLAAGYDDHPGYAETWRP